MEHKVPLTIVGGGVVGLSIAYGLLASGWKDIVLLEKNDDLGREQSARSSGVIHSGIFNKPGSLMSALCVPGSRKLYEFCRRYKIPHKKTGKLIVAADKEENMTLDHFLERAVQNGVAAEKKTANGVRSIEPLVNAYSGIYCPETGIIDAPSYIKNLETVIQRMPQSKHMIKGAEVVGIQPKNGNFVIYVDQPRSDEKQWSLETEVLINSAGLYSVDIANMVNAEQSAKKMYLKGEFYQFSSPNLCLSTCIYPVPKKVRLSSEDFFEDYGIHLTPKVMLNGSSAICQEVLVGPKFSETDDAVDMMQTQPVGIFHGAVGRFYPAIEKKDLYQAHAGVLGIVKGHNDFIINEDRKYPGCINLLGMESPALTASLEIGRYVAEQLS